MNHKKAGTQGRICTQCGLGDEQGGSFVVRSLLPLELVEEYTDESSLKEMCGMKRF